MSRGRNDEALASSSRSTRPAGFFTANNNNSTSNVNSRNGSSNVSNNSPVGNTNFNIRGLSGGANSGMSIRGESGPSIVVISNLDPGANAEDVKVKDLKKILLVELGYSCSMDTGMKKKVDSTVYSP